MAPPGIRYSDGALASVVSCLKSADALTVMPHSVVFSQRKERTITALPINIPHPERALAILRRVDAPRSPPVEQFSTFIRSSFDSLKHLIKRHEEAVVWGN
ncbi:DNA-binding transcriptional LysR family regulator [Peteryoungia aggregata LMG 23059]|uniref:DNA-binding transcriptional LysR family regulator n=1 Tax=Peteryoungia aggregata LMG 23059 TaxID=1368425 RepID=A0ABU0G3Z2_9HYPH|nr:DNA-binding transcriptional LysR family regulator [Peteryoungia aggregata LMG 23059]